jgi:hypothetical protein
MPRKSDFINSIGCVLALTTLVAVGLNVRKTYRSVTSTAHPRVAGAQKLVIGHAKIRARRYFFAPFRIDGAMEGAHVVGAFHTAGGPTNVIEVVIAEQRQLEKWSYGQAVPLVYSTEKTTHARLDLPIDQRGDYYLGFSNLFSRSDKDVFADIELRFVTH